MIPVMVSGEGRKSSAAVVWRRLKRVLPVFTVIGLGMSLWNLYKSGESRRSLDDIARGISTRYLSEFPEDVADITQFVGETRRTLDIVVDFSAYGSWSSPARFDDYKQALMKLGRNGKQVRMYIYDSDTAKQELEKQLKVTEEQFKNEIVGKAKWNAYFAFHAKAKRPDRSEEWYRILNEEEEGCLQELQDARIHVVRRPGPFPIFFWLRDDEQAIFTFPTFDPKDPNETRSVAFFSRDAKFKEVLKANLKRVSDPNR
ncbi:MAG TPA: hypothetical protein VER03_03010 [Bryobacteraceae bacterium]|nr:hypothetical protein [Bryobacteraceae bacterium]